MKTFITQLAIGVLTIVVAFALIEGWKQFKAKRMASMAAAITTPEPDPNDQD